MQIPDGLFFSEVKNKPNDGIVIHAFILGAGVVTTVQINRAVTVDYSDAVN